MLLCCLGEGSYTLTDVEDVIKTCPYTLLTDKSKEAQGMDLLRCTAVPMFARRYMTCAIASLLSGLVNPAAAPALGSGLYLMVRGNQSSSAHQTQPAPQECPAAPAAPSQTVVCSAPVPRRCPTRLPTAGSHFPYLLQKRPPKCLC